MIIGISGNATSGKDTLYKILEEHFKARGLDAVRFALADCLKAEVDEFCKKSYGISVYTTNPKEKAAIRPFLVGYGKSHRIISRGRYFIEKLEKVMEGQLGIKIITDIRYDEHDADEYGWLKSQGGLLFYVERYQDGRLVPPANEEERVNNLKLRGKADFLISWNTFGENEQNDKLITKTIKEIVDDIIGRI